MQIFNARVCVTLFDIYTHSPDRKELLEEQFCIKMEDGELEFLQDQRGSRIGYCVDFMGII